MVRVILLLQVSNVRERERLVQSTLHGERWRVLTRNGRLRYVTDREMVDLSQHLIGWTLSVYKFGCAFVHLSDFHNYFCQNPFEKLLAEERQDILSHLRYYHGGPRSDNPRMEELACPIPRVFAKIADNLECYVKDLEQGEVIEADCGQPLAASPFCSPRGDL